MHGNPAMVIACVLGVLNLTWAGCTQGADNIPPRSGSKHNNSMISTGRNQVRENESKTRRSPMDMPEWYRELIEEAPETARAIIREDSSMVRGYW